MKILLLVQFFHSSRGGGEVMFSQLAEGLAERGHKIYVIRHKILNENKYEGRNRNIRIRIHSIFPPVEHKGGLPASILQNLLYFFNCLRISITLIKKEQIDIIHANSYTPILVGWILSRLTRRPLLVTIHDIGSTHGFYFWEKWMKQFGKQSKLKALIGYIIELISVKISKNIHTVSEASKEDILRLKFKEKNVYVIPNALDVLKYSPHCESIEYVNEIAFIGRLVFYKNLEVILKALSHIAEHEVKLLVIGDGPMRYYWQKLAEDLGVAGKVEFMGYLSHEEKVRILRKVSALVLPSLFEGFGMVILEAWTCKKPVIVADLPPLNQIVEHGKDGFIVNPFKSEEWAKHISLLISDKELAKKLGLNGYSKLIEKYNAMDWITKFEELYHELIARK
ncbi:MAG: glycosyltransferase family 4 protein [Saccharolobus sp.]|uniref:glycosyltransferase family 4 protein n=1 Tax=Saccharolobus sp. TaxID=2100761 RepID=UPI00317247D0